MTSHKKWNEIYSKENPLSLPQTISRKLKAFIRTKHGDGAESGLRYLWIHIAGDTNGNGDSEPRPELTEEEWYCVIDEAAANGVESIVITAGACLCEHPEVWSICQWAQTQHALKIGIHTDSSCLDGSQTEHLRMLDPSRTRVFVDGDVTSLPHIEALGIPVVPVHGLDHGMGHVDCDLPTRMSCVDGHGEMYTCGLVLGQEQFALGNVSERRIDRVMRDQSLPHCVPPEVSRDTVGRCNGCPELIEQHLHEQLR